MDFPSLLAAADGAALNALGGAIRYVPSMAATVDVRGVFDNADANATVQGQEVNSSGPRLFLRVADLTSDPATEPKGYPRFIIGATTYSARNVAKDGQGGVLLELVEVE
jgi:hypothetical protein